MFWQKKKKQPGHEVIINGHILRERKKISIWWLCRGEGAFWKGKKYIFKEMKIEMRCRCKGHNGFGMDWGAHFRVSASCRYWQVLKTFKEVKTLFSVYKSWALPQMLVKSDVHRLTHLPHIGLGSFSSTNKRSQNILSQIWNIFWWKALTAFCFVRSLLPAQPLLWCSGNQWPGTWLVFRPEEGFWDTWGAPNWR